MILQNKSMLMNEMFVRSNRICVRDSNGKPTVRRNDERGLGMNSPTPMKRIVIEDNMCDRGHAQNKLYMRFVEFS